MTEAGEAEAIGLGPEDPLADAVALGALAYGLEQPLTAPDPAAAPKQVRVAEDQSRAVVAGSNTREGQERAVATAVPAAEARVTVQTQTS